MRVANNLQGKAAIELEMPKTFTSGNEALGGKHKTCKAGMCSERCSSLFHVGPTAPDSSMEMNEDSLGMTTLGMTTASGFWDTVHSMNTVMLTRYTNEFRKTNAFATTVFKMTEQNMSLYSEKKVNLCFTLRLLQRAWIRIANLALDIWFLVLAENEADGIRSWVFWTLLSLHILPVPILFLRNTHQCRTSFLTILNLSSLVEFRRSSENGEWTDELIVIDILEAFLTTLPSAIIQLFVLITQVQAHTTTWIFTALATSLSLVSAASKLSGVEFLVFGIYLKNLAELVQSCLFSIYCIIDITLSTFFIAVCIENFNSFVYHDIPWGGLLLLFRYVSRLVLHLAIYCERGSIRRYHTSTRSSMVAFAFVAGLVEWSTGLFFLHEIVMQGALWLFALWFLGTLELGAMIICIYEDEESVLHEKYMYVLACVTGLQIAKLFIILAKRYPKPNSQKEKKHKMLPTVRCPTCGEGTTMREISRYTDL